MRQDGRHVDDHVQRVAELVKVREQPDGRVGDDDAHLGEAAKEAVWRARARAPQPHVCAGLATQQRMSLRSSEEQAYSSFLPDKHMSLTANMSHLQQEFIHMRQARRWQRIRAPMQKLYAVPKKGVEMRTPFMTLM